MRYPCIAVTGSAIVYVLCSGATAWAQEATLLQEGTQVVRDIQPGETHAYLVHLEASQFASATIEARTGTVRAAAFDPEGTRIRRFGAGPDGKTRPVLAAETSGEYRLEVTVPEDAAAATYAITLDDTVTVDDQAAWQTEEPFVSPRLKALVDRLAQGDASALEQFWDDVGREGTPIVEPFLDSDQHQLVTFVWRAVGPTRNVLVEWIPFSWARPRDHLMAHVPDTDLWYKTRRIRRGARFLYMLAPNVFQFAPPSPTTPYYRNASAVADPLNPTRVPADGSKYEAQSVAELPGSPPHPWSGERLDVPRGHSESREFTSSILKNERTIEIYTPPDYSTDGDPYPVLIVFDQGLYTTGARVPTPTILDNLIADRRIGPMMAVLVGNASGQRGTELPCNVKFADFLRTELMPWVRRSYHATAEAAQTYAAGSSFGGLAATCAAMFHPQLVGNVISQMGVSI